MLIKSLYTYFFEKNDKYYLYNSLTGFFCEVSRKTYERLYNREYMSLDKETIEYLREKKVLIEEEEKYLFYLECKSKYYGVMNDDSALGLVIAPTIQCNFNCPYCFESKSSNKVMSYETEIKLVDFIRRHERAKAINLTWYGGEPLVAFDRIKSIWHHFSKDLPKIKIQNHSIVTNGSLITDSVINFFKNTAVSFVQITLDGIKDNHNATRCLKDGTPTFDVVFANIIKTAKAIPSSNVAVRVNVNRNNPGDYAKIYKLFEREGCKNISVYPGFIREDVKDGNILSYNSFSEESCHEFFKSSAECGVKTSFFPSKCISKGCLMESAYAFVIGPDGEIYKCWNDVGHKNRVIGNISDNHPTNKLRLYQYLNETSAFSDPRCKDCFVFPVCDGGCGHYRYRNIFENSEFDLCTRFKNKTVLEESLLMSIKQ